jgi:hypothetical protein
MQAGVGKFELGLCTRRGQQPDPGRTLSQIVQQGGLSNTCGTVEEERRAVPIPDAGEDLIQPSSFRQSGKHGLRIVPL